MSPTRSFPRRGTLTQPVIAKMLYVEEAFPATENWPPQTKDRFINSLTDAELGA
jgi:hypothetical protein